MSATIHLFENYTELLVEAGVMSEEQAATVRMLLRREAAAELVGGRERVKDYQRDEYERH